MAQIVVRISDDERSAVDVAAARAGMNLSEYVRSYVPEFGGTAVDATDRLDDHERRLSRLEELAGM